MKKNILILVLMLFFTTTYSQSNSAKSSKSELNLFQNYRTSNVNVFLNDDWQGGNIFAENNATVKGYVYKYNIYTDQIEVKAIINPSSVEYISIGGNIFVHTDYINSVGDTYEGYFEVIVKGDCQLLLKRSMKRDNENNIDVVLGGSTASASEVKENFYVKKDNEPAVIVKSKEHLIETLSDKEDFTEYLDDKFVLFLNKRKLTEFIKYYNQL